MQVITTLDDTKSFMHTLKTFVKRWSHRDADVCLNVLLTTLIVDKKAEDKDFVGSFDHDHVVFIDENCK